MEAGISVIGWTARIQGVDGGTSMSVDIFARVQPQ